MSGFQKRADQKQTWEHSVDFCPYFIGSKKSFSKKCLSLVFNYNMTLFLPFRLSTGPDVGPKSIQHRLTDVGVLTYSQLRIDIRISHQILILLYQRGYRFHELYIKYISLNCYAFAKYFLFLAVFWYRFYVIPTSAYRCWGSNIEPN